MEQTTVDDLSEGDNVVLKYSACGVARGRDAILVEVDCSEEQYVTEVGTGRQLRIGSLRYPCGETTTEVMDRDNNAREGVDVEIRPAGEYGAFA